MSSDTTGSKGASTQDALQLLHADHRRISALLDDCKRLAADGDGAAHSSADRSGLVARLGALLQAHAQVEQELFYPAINATAASLDQARQDHGHIAGLLARLVADEEEHGAFGDRVEALVQAVRGHVADEEEQLFAAASALAPEELQAIGSRMAVRRAELMGDQGVD